MATDATYPVETIAKLLDLTPRRVYQLTNEGIIPKASRGRYELVSAANGYIKYLRDRAINADVKDGDADHRKRLTKARADIAEFYRPHPGRVLRGPKTYAGRRSA